MQKISLSHLVVIISCGFCATVQASNPGNPDEENPRGSSFIGPQPQRQLPFSMEEYDSEHDNCLNRYIAFLAYQATQPNNGHKIQTDR
jgi:hypothetical protein